MESFHAVTGLEAWKEGVLLKDAVYAITNTFPKTEQYGLISQMRKASVSILANLAEGYSRSTADDKAHKYVISRGECSEVYALLLISSQLGYGSKEEITKAQQSCMKVGKLLSGLIRRYRNNS